MRKYRKTIAMMLMATLSAALMSGCAGSGDQAASVQSSSADGGTQEQTDTAGTVSEASSIETAETGDSGAGKIAYSGGKQTITYWHTHSDAEEEVLMDQIIPEFEKEYPDITVEAVRMPYDGLMQQIITSLSSGTGPDIMRMDIIWVPELAQMGALVPVDDLTGFSDLRQNLYEGPLSTNYYNGKYYGLPLNTNCLSGIYSKAMMDQLGLTEIPKTYDEVVALKDKLGENQYLITTDDTNTWATAPLFYSLGGTYTNDDYSKASGYLNGEDSVKALQTIVDWYDQGIIGPSATGGKPDSANGLYDGDYLFGYQGPWFWCNDEEDNLAKVEGGLLPSGPAGSRSVVGGEDLVLFNSSEKQEASWVFAMFLMGDFAQKAQAVGGGHLIPTVKSVAESEEVQNTPNMSVFIDQLENAVSRTPSPAWNKMSDKITLAFQSCIRHEDTPQHALDQLAPVVDSMLDGTYEDTETAEQ